MAHRVRWYGAARRSEAPVAAVLVLRGATAAAAAIGAPLAVYSLLRVGRRLEDLRRVDSVGRRLPPALHRLMPAKPPGRSRPVAPRRLGGSSRVARAALAITGGEGGAGGGGKPGELQAAARFAQRPGCSRNHLHLRGGERGAVAAVALAGEHRGGAYLRCTRLQAGRTGLQAVCTGSQAFVRSASLPLPLPLTLTLALTPVLPPTHRKPSRKRSPRWPPHRPQRACTAPRHRLNGLCGTWLQPLLRTSGDAARLGAEHRRLHWP